MSKDQGNGHTEQRESEQQSVDQSLRYLQAYLKQEIAVQLLSNRICLNNIAALRMLQQIDPEANRKAIEENRIKLEFDLTVRERQQSESTEELLSEGDLVPLSGRSPLPMTEAPDGGTPSVPDAGSGGPVDAGADAGTWTTTRVQTTTSGSWRVKADFGFFEVEATGSSEVQTTDERR